MNIPSLAAASIFAAALVLSPVAEAAELKVIAGGSMTASMNALAPDFEKATGHKLSIHFDSTPNLIKQATSGAPFDLGVVPVDVFKDAAAKARFAPGSTIDIARVGYGVAVRAGAPKPDVSTSAALKKTLLDAQSIATIPASAAGAYVGGVFERLRGAPRRSNPAFFVQSWIASRSLSSGAHSRDPLARNDGETIPNQSEV
jgi:molybdate transport system substrate-binding protein